MDVPAIFMQRCLDLALLGKGNVAPNPMVGCVITYNNKVIGEGYHKKYGEAHAEVNAISSVKNRELLEHSTMYVSLEPCSHYGKTPPCTNLIIENQIPRVVVGTVDPSDKVSGKGISQMREAGIEVIVGLLENECRELNRRFFTFHREKRPYIILKLAQTLDGFIAPEQTTKPVWISNSLSKRLVHKQRSEESAILVGRRTAQTDNPALTVREWTGNQPIRISIDQKGQLSSDLLLFDGEAHTLIFSGTKNCQEKDKLEFIGIDFTKDIIPQILTELYSRNILSLIVEGGSITLESFVKQGLWDEANIYVGNHFFGSGVPAPKIKGEITATEQLDECKLLIINNNKIDTR